MHLQKLILIISIPLLFITVDVKAQNCDNYFESMCVMPGDWNYEINSQSMSIPVYVGQTIKFNAVFYEGYEYAVSFFTLEELGTIQYRLISTDINYENSFNSYDKSISTVVFYNEATRNIVVEVKIQRNQNRIDPSDRKCFSIIIGQKETDEYDDL